MSDEFADDVAPPRAPSPGLAAVLSVIIPGLGHVYAGRLIAGLVWFACTGFGYWAILVPGVILHGLAIWFAYRAARDFRRY